MFMPRSMIEAGNCNVNTNFLEIVLDKLCHLQVFAIPGSVLEIYVKPPPIAFHWVSGLIQQLGGNLWIIWDLLGIGVMPPCGEWCERNVPDTRITASEVNQFNDLVLIYRSSQSLPHRFVLKWVLP